MDKYDSQVSQFSVSLFSVSPSIRIPLGATAGDLRFQNGNSRWPCCGLVKPEIVYNGKIPNTDTDVKNRHGHTTTAK